MHRQILNCISTIDEFNVEEYNRLGIGVEIQDFTEPNLEDHEIASLVRRYKQLFKGFQQKKAMHGPFLDLKPSSPDRLIRAISQQRYEQVLHIAAELEMDYVIFHSQIHPSLTEPNLARLNNLQGREAWLEMTGRANDYQGLIVLENVFEGTPAQLKALVETIDLPNIKINLDVGHCKLSQEPLESWINDLNRHLAYIHLHSNNGIHDHHARVSRQEIEHLQKLLDRYGISPVIALEYPVDDLKVEMDLFEKGSK